MAECRERGWGSCGMRDMTECYLLYLRCVPGDVLNGFSSRLMVNHPIQANGNTKLNKNIVLRVKHQSQQLKSISTTVYTTWQIPRQSISTVLSKCPSLKYLYYYYLINICQVSMLHGLIPYILSLIIICQVYSQNWTITHFSLDTKHFFLETSLHLDWLIWRARRAKLVAMTIYDVAGRRRDQKGTI